MYKLIGQEAQPGQSLSYKEVPGGHRLSGKRFANQVKDLCGTQVEVGKRSELHKFVVLPVVE